MAETNVKHSRIFNEVGAREGFASAGIRLEWSDNLVTALAREGYDHRFGALPSQRALERLVVTPLARWESRTYRASERRVKC